MRRRALAGFLSAALLGGAASAAGELKGLAAGGAGRVGQVCEVVVDAPGEGGDPFDPDSMALDASIRAPSGAKCAVSGFWLVPHREQRLPPPRKVARLVRVFLPTRDFRPAQNVRLLIDDIRLADIDGNRTEVLDDFEGRPAWRAVGLDAAVERGSAKVGQGALRMELTVPDVTAWPGVNWELPDADWGRVGEVRLWLRPLEGLDEGGLRMEFWTPEGRKFQGSLDVARPGEKVWQEAVWKVAPAVEEARFVPAGPDARGQWRVRFLPLEAGPHEVRLSWRGGGQTRGGSVVVDVRPGGDEGLVRVSPDDPRYLELSSGRAWFPVGINLLGQELGHYRYYLDRLAACGGNFIRLWLSPRTMGFELKAGRYDQARAAQLDELLGECRRRNIRVMVCLTDFREVCAFHREGHWRDSPFSAANGGPCRKPEEFFTEPSAARLYERKLRYLVARWAADPAVLAWEFFNEVDITDGWKKEPGAVRAWHERMAGRLSGMDPYARPVTSSFSGLDDDELWSQDGMRIVQRHLYLRPGEAFVPAAADATRRLARHGKPVLIGEFGRPDEVSPQADVRGVALHNGLWSSAMAGGCGAAMPWWWESIDACRQWGRLASIAAFLKDVDFPREAFAPLEGAASAALAPGEALPPVRILPHHRAWRPAPYNEPVALTLDPDGRPDRPDLLSAILHGVRNHVLLHNPVAITAQWERDGQFIVDVAEVSRHGGSGLSIALDDREAFRLEFPYADDPNQPTRPYAGRYGVPVPAGRHTVHVEALGKDWLRVRAYELDGARQAPPVRLLGLRGRCTVLAWLWNGTHQWAEAVTGWRPAAMANVTADLRGLPAGTWRIRPYDPWQGRWGKAAEAAVGADGRLTLTVDRLEADVAWRLDKAR